MSLKPVDAVAIFCDGCGSQYSYGGEYDYFLREQVSDWLGNDAGWREEDGKHYCCGHSSTSRVNDCWPPSMNDWNDD